MVFSISQVQPLEGASSAGKIPRAPASSRGLQSVYVLVPFSTWCAAIFSCVFCHFSSSSRSRNLFPLASAAEMRAAFKNLTGGSWDPGCWDSVRVVCALDQTHAGTLP